jgi:hypothetical protein
VVGAPNATHEGIYPLYASSSYKYTKTLQKSGEHGLTPLKRVKVYNARLALIMFYNARQVLNRYPHKQKNKKKRTEEIPREHTL